MAKASKKTAEKAPKKTAEKAPKKTAEKAPKKTAEKASKQEPQKAPKKSGGKGTGRKPNAAFMAPVTVSDSLAQVTGSKPLPRTEIIKKIWEYIKKNNLQDSENKRMINADEKLAAIFGDKKQISMFELAKVVNDHVNVK